MTLSPYSTKAAHWLIVCSVKESPPIPLDDEKSLHATVDQAKTVQLNRHAHKPAPDHPWKRTVSPPSSQAT